MCQANVLPSGVVPFSPLILPAKINHVKEVPGGIRTMLAELLMIQTRLLDGRLPLPHHNLDGCITAPLSTPPPNILSEHLSGGLSWQNDILLSAPVLPDVSLQLGSNTDRLWIVFPRFLAAVVC